LPMKLPSPAVELFNIALVVPAKLGHSVSPGEVGGLGALPFTLKVVVELGVTLNVSLPEPPLAVRLVALAYGIAVPGATVTEVGVMVQVCPVAEPSVMVTALALNILV